VSGQHSGKFVGAWVSASAKEKFHALAAEQGLTQSALLQRLIDRATEPFQMPAGNAAAEVGSGARSDRLYVRLYPDDRQLLAERAGARGMPSATYLAVLARAHLRRIPPLPEAERQALERCVAELSAIGRNLNQVARRANQEGVVSSISRTDLALFLKICTSTVAHFKDTLKSNKLSWEVGYETTDR
jgi:Mobilization protein NikA